MRRIKIVMCAVQINTNRLAGRVSSPYRERLVCLETSQSVETSMFKDYFSQSELVCLKNSQSVETSMFKDLLVRTSMFRDQSVESSRTVWTSPSRLPLVRLDQSVEPTVVSRDQSLETTTPEQSVKISQTRLVSRYSSRDCRSLQLVPVFT